MNRLDFFNIFDLDGHNLEESNRYFEAIDAVYKFLCGCPDVKGIIWEKESDYDLTFIIHTSKPINVESIDAFVHLQKMMELHVDDYYEGTLNIHINYKKL